MKTTKETLSERVFREWTLAGKAGKNKIRDGLIIALAEILSREGGSVEIRNDPNPQWN